MNLSNTSRVQQLTFFNTSILAFIGIYLSGYDQVHWFMYVVPVVYLLSSITGFRPGIAISRLMLREKANNTTSNA